MDVQALHRNELHEFPFSAQEHISPQRDVYSKTRSGTISEDARARVRRSLVYKEIWQWRQRRKYKHTVFYRRYSRRGQY